MRYLVTGGAGFLGSALVRSLAGSGHQVVVLDDFSSGKYERLNDVDRQVRWGDVRRPDDVSEAAKGAESVLHLAYIQGTKNFYEKPSEILSVALEGMQAVLRACRVNGIRELVLVSSAEAHQSAELPTPESTPLMVPDVLNPRFSYGGGKIACELMAAAAYHDGLLDRVIIIRPHNVIGPDMCPDHVIPDLCERLAHLGDDEPLVIQGSGAETRCYSYITDAVDQIRLIMNHAGPLGAYHIGSQDERSTLDVAREVARCYGKEKVKIISSPLAKGSPLRRQPGLDFLDGLGYKPKVSFEETIYRTVEWYRSRA